eukprot:6179229-Pleurochrysis_carterae.AAC.1
MTVAQDNSRIRTKLVVQQCYYGYELSDGISSQHSLAHYPRGDECVDLSTRAVRPRSNEKRRRGRYSARKGQDRGGEPAVKRRDGEGKRKIRPVKREREGEGESAYSSMPLWSAGAVLPPPSQPVAASPFQPAPPPPPPPPPPPSPPP